MDPISKLLANYKVITSNVEGKTTEEKVAKARVILLCEAHGYKSEVGKKHGHNGSKSEKLNDRLVNHLFREGDLNLVEGYVERAELRLLDKRVLGSTKCWDLDDDESCYNLAHALCLKTQELCALYEGCLSQGIKDDSAYREIYEGLVQYVQEVRPFRSTWDEKGPLAAVDHLLPFWMEIVKRMSKEILNELHRSFLPRNRSMAKNILAYRGRVFVTTGADHLKYRDSGHFKAVDEVYNELKKNQVPYVTLQPRKKGIKQTKREIAGTLHSKEAAEKKYRAHLKRREDQLLEYREGLESELAGYTKLGELKALKRHARKLVKEPTSGYPEADAVTLLQVEILIQQLIQSMRTYSHPTKDIDQLLKPYKIITSNIQEKVIESLVNQAQVVILAEQTASESMRVNDRLLNGFVRKGDLVLTTQGPKQIQENHWRDLDVKVLAAANSWDMLVKQEKSAISLGTAMINAAYNLANYYHKLSSNDEAALATLQSVHEFCVGSIQKVRPFKPIWDKNRPVECIHEIMRIWLKEVEVLGGLIQQLFQKNLHVRSQLIIKSILAYKGSGRVFVLPHLSHVKYDDPIDFKSVDKFYVGLKGLRYVTLQSRKSGVEQTKREKVGTLHSKEVAEEKFRTKEQKSLENEREKAEHFKSFRLKEGRHAWLKALKEHSRDTIDWINSGPINLERVAMTLFEFKFLIQQLQRARPLQSKL